MDPKHSAFQNTTEKPEVSTLEYSSPHAVSKPTFRQRFVAHQKKWWWAHLLFTVVVTLVVTLPCVLVLYPNIAKKAVRESTLTITAMSALEPTPDSFRLIETQVVGTNSPYHPHFYAFNVDVGLLGDAPFGTITIPAFDVKDGAELFVNQTVKLNTYAYTRFSKEVVMNEEVPVNVVGKVALKQGGLPKITVDYNKTVTLKGLNKLEGFDIPEFQVFLSPLPSGNNMNGTAVIPNPSIMTLEMGDMVNDLSVDGVHIGQSFMHNVVLQPGDNKIPMEALTNQSVVLSMINGENAKHRDGMLPVSITTASISRNGARLSYYEEAMAGAPLTVTLNVGKAIQEAASSLNH